MLHQEVERKPAEAFIVAAFLMSGAVEPRRWWFGYLDEVEAALERQAS